MNLGWTNKFGTLGRGRQKITLTPLERDTKMFHAFLVKSTVRYYSLKRLAAIKLEYTCMEEGMIVCRVGRQLEELWCVHSYRIPHIIKRVLHTLSTTVFYFETRYLDDVEV